MISSILLCYATVWIKTIIQGHCWWFCFGWDPHCSRCLTPLSFPWEGSRSCHSQGCCSHDGWHRAVSSADRSILDCSSTARCSTLAFHQRSTSYNPLSRLQSSLWCRPCRDLGLSDVSRGAGSISVDQCNRRFSCMVAFWGAGGITKILYVHEWGKKFLLKNAQVLKHPDLQVQIYRECWHQSWSYLTKEANG